MTWEEVNKAIAVAAEDERERPKPDLIARQIQSNGHPDPYFNFMRWMAIGVREKGVFLEIGSYYGTLAAHIASPHSYGFHPHLMVGIDINPVPYSSLGFLYVHGDSTDPKTFREVERIADYHGGIFAVFQDSSHHYEASVKEWEMYRPMVRPGGIWMADDVTPAFKRPDEPKGMVEYFDELPGDKRVFDDLHIGSRIGMVLL